MSNLFRVFALFLLIFSALLVFGACKKTEAVPDAEEGDADIQHVHLFGEWSEIAPSCNEAGIRTGSCPCGETESQNLPALGHADDVFVIVSQFEATCHEPGFVEYEIYCSRCGFWVRDEIVESDRLAHIVTSREEILLQPTCSYPGVKQIIDICELCGDVFDSYSTSIEALAHTPGKIIRQDVTSVGCTQNGLYYNNQYCSVCNGIISSEEVIITATGHTIGKTTKENFVDADCFNEGGYDEVSYCKTCASAISVNHVTLSILSHTPGAEIKENIKSSCEYELARYCTLCGYETFRSYVTMDTAVHTPGKTVTNTKASSCSEEGYEEVTVYCSDCNYVISRTVTTIPKLEHTPRAGATTVITPATCTEGGVSYKKITCKICREDLGRSTFGTDPIGHNYSAEKTEILVEVSCTLAGTSRQYSICSNCGDTKYGAEYEVAALGHNTLTKKTDSLDATCTTDGYINYVTTCNRCNEEIATKTVVLAATGHKNSTSVKENVIESTCAEKGSYDTVIYCRYCSIELSRETSYTSKKAHTKSELVIQNEVETSCTAPGSYDEVIYCTVCLQDISRNTITVEQIAHDYVVANCKYCGVEAEYKLGKYLELTEDGTGYIIKSNVSSLQEIVYATSYQGIPIVEIQGLDTRESTVKIVIGKHVRTISQNAFSQTGVQVFEIQEGNQFFSVKDGNLYSADGKELVRMANSESNKTVVIDSSLRGFYSGAFIRNKSVESVTINGCADSFTNSTFYSCTSLKELTINIDMDIPSYAFSHCAALETVNIYGNVKEIKANAFYKCNSLKTVNYTGNFEKIGYEAFFDCPLLEEFPFGDKLNYIGEQAFAASGIKRIELRNPVEIGQAAFASCLSLEYADIRGATVVDENAFYNCTNLKFVILGSSLSELPMWVFRECRALNDLGILNPQINIDSSAFINTEINTVYFSGDEEQWNPFVEGDNRVYELRYVDTVFYYSETKPLMPGDYWHFVDGEITAWPDIVEGEGSKGLRYQINEDCMSYTIVGLGSCRDEIVVIPDTYNDLPVVAIGRIERDIGAPSPKEFIIPDSVTYISGDAFKRCSGFEQITLSNNLTEICPDTFKDCRNLKEIDIPEGVVKIGANAFYGCSSLTEITLPRSLKEIDSTAFGECDALIGIHYKGGQTEWENNRFSDIFGYNVILYFLK